MVNVITKIDSMNCPGIQLRRLKRILISA